MQITEKGAEFQVNAISDGFQIWHFPDPSREAASLGIQFCSVAEAFLESQLAHVLPALPGILLFTIP